MGLFKAYSVALKDMAAALKHRDLCYEFSIEAIKQKYRRSMLGAAWIAIGFGLVILVKTTVFGAFASASPEYFVKYLTIGYAMWSLISSLIQDSAEVYVSNEAWIKGEPLPLSTYIIISFLKSLYPFLINMPVVLVVIFLLGFPVTTALFTLPLVFVAYFVNSIWASMLIGLVCARHRDFVHTVQAILRIAFFVTPIIWMPSQFPHLEKIALYNPLTHYLEIFRRPIIDGVIPMTSWAVVLTITFSMLLIAIPVFGYFKKRLVYWL